MRKIDLADLAKLAEETSAELSAEITQAAKLVSLALGPSIGSLYAPAPARSALLRVKEQAVEWLAGDKQEVRPTEDLLGLDRALAIEIATELANDIIQPSPTELINFIFNLVVAEARELAQNKLCYASADMPTLPGAVVRASGGTDTTEYFSWIILLTQRKASRAVASL